MKCPGCGHESLDLLETCKHCGAPPIDPADDLLGLRFEPELSTSGQRPLGQGRRQMPPGSRVDRDGDFVAMVEMLDDDDGALPFQIDDDLFLGHDQGCFWPAPAADLPGPAFALPAEELDNEADGESIIDRDDEVPERYWAPEIAGLGRRALALLVDQSLLAAVLGVFALGAFLGLRLRGFDTGLFLSASGLQASALPFVLLAALLSLAYYSYFHGSTGRTPGKALFGIEVRTGAGGAPTWGRVVLRWLGAVLGLACAGVGIVWVVFEPRRRGWADLISGTVVARQRQDTASHVVGVH